MPDGSCPEAFQACVRTPFATLGIAATDTHVTGIRFLAPSIAAMAPKKNTIAYLACVQIQAYLEDPAFVFDLPLKLAGTHHRARGVGGDAEAFPPARRAPTASSRRSSAPRRARWAERAARIRFRSSCRAIA